MRPVRRAQREAEIAAHHAAIRRPAAGMGTLAGGGVVVEIGQLRHAREGQPAVNEVPGRQGRPAGDPGPRMGAGDDLAVIAAPRHGGAAEVAEAQIDGAIAIEIERQGLAVDRGPAEEVGSHDGGRSGGNGEQKDRRGGLRKKTAHEARLRNGRNAAGTARPAFMGAGAGFSQVLHEQMVNTAGNARCRGRPARNAKGRVRRPAPARALPCGRRSLVFQRLDCLLQVFLGDFGLGDLCQLEHVAGHRDPERRFEARLRDHRDGGRAGRQGGREAHRSAAGNRDEGLPQGQGSAAAAEEAVRPAHPGRGHAGSHRRRDDRALRAVRRPSGAAAAGQDDQRGLERGRRRRRRNVLREAAGNPGSRPEVDFAGEAGRQGVRRGSGRSPEEPRRERQELGRPDRGRLCREGRQGHHGLRRQG